MSSASSSDVKLEIGHVLFIDIVGYSKLLINEQSEQMQKLREIVRGTEQFRLAEAEGKLLRLPTGDGGAVVFLTNLEAPVLCALEIAEALKDYPELCVRIGIHSGPVNEVTDLNEQANIAGAGINIAQRVMDCGDAGHILLSRHVAEDLEQYRRWQPLLHDLGECEVKHGACVHVFNLYAEGVGNPEVPEKLRQARLDQVPEKSVAVLPFENRSEEKANAYFAAGIQDEILTRLCKIADLKVISRTSTQQYQSKPGNLCEIARQLGVAHILEGSVQKSGDAVRVNVQLIKAANDSHLWADTYDRKLTDIFEVQSEIAKGIADSLRVKLSSHEEQALVVKPTNNSEAYDAYLRGLAFDARVRSFADVASLMPKAIDSFKRAVQLDRNFALSWARLSRAHAFLYFFPFDATSARRDAARKALENAQKVQPNSPDTLLALGYYQYMVLRDYGAAKTTFERVSKMLPGSGEVPKALGYIARREGHWDKSIAYFEEALAVDPRNVELLTQAAVTYTVGRRFPAALKLYDRVLDITPNDSDVIAYKAAIYQARGNLQEAAKLLSEVNAQTSSSPAFHIKITELRLERNLGEAIRLQQARQTQFHFASELDKGNNQLWLALTQHLNGDAAGAKVTAAQARNTLEPLYTNQPDNAVFVAMLSQANFMLGEKEAALKEAERAITLLPSIEDRMLQSILEENAAAIQMMVGENSSRAISTLTRLLQTPYPGCAYGYGRTPVTPALLRLDPLWDPLRADPAFRKLYEEKQP